MAKTPKSSLAETHPEIAAQADGWDPTTVTKGSNKRVSWECGHGHIWIAKPNDRSKGIGCPVCSNKKVLVGYNDLATTNPELAAQADGWDPTTLTAHSGKKVGWRCEQGHKWTSSLDNRSNGKGCPICSGNKVLAGYNDLATTNPELAAQADGWDPTTLMAHSGKKVGWRCKKGHEWDATIADRSAGRGCPVCSNKKVLAGYNDLATTNPDLAAQADGWDPTTLTAGSDKKVGWRCEKGHGWTAVLSSRSGGNQCPVCANQLVQVGYNDLATTNPDLAAQADGWDPTTVLAHSNRMVGWRCEQGHKWNARQNNRARGIGCPICSGHQVLAGYNDLATTNPDLAAQADGWDPTTLTQGSGTKVEWKCKQGHTWIAAVTTRSGGDNCPVCSNKKVLVGYNDLATTNPELAAQAHGWDPTTVTTHSNKKVGWKCKQGHTWQTKVTHRSNGIGCPSCSVTGFDPNKDGWLYFVEHDALQMFQIGISNIPVSRLGQHSKRGWEVIEVRGPMKGHLAQQLEISCLHALGKRGAILGHKAGMEKFDGYTEAWTKKSLSVTSIKQILNWVYEDESK